MKILVIGNGFIGKPIIQRLESEGHDVLVYSRQARQEIYSKQINGDIFDSEKISKIFSWSPQIVIQTAWVTNHHQYLSDPSNFEFAKFTINLTELLHRANVEHYIVLGSAAEYGPQFTPVCAGQTPINPGSTYAKQKVEAFKKVNRILTELNIRFSWARVFQPYGLCQDKKRLIPYLISALRQGEKIHLLDSTRSLDWITTNDVASAISWIIQNETPIEVDLGTTVGTSNIQLLKCLEAKISGTNHWEFYNSKISVDSDVLIVSKDSPLFKSGWRPNHNIDTGLDWVLANEKI